MPGSETSKAIMFFYVYVLKSLRYPKELYIWYTEYLKRRIEEHNRSLNRSTGPYKPWKLIYYEACSHEQDAKRREGYFKTSQGRRLLKGG